MFLNAHTAFRKHRIRYTVIVVYLPCNLIFAVDKYCRSITWVEVECVCPMALWLIPWSSAHEHVTYLQQIPLSCLKVY